MSLDLVVIDNIGLFGWINYKLCFPSKDYNLTFYSNDKKAISHLSEIQDADAIIIRHHLRGLKGYEAAFTLQAVGCTQPIFYLGAGRLTQKEEFEKIMQIKNIGGFVKNIYSSKKRIDHYFHRS